jgi:hypothetical protein
MVSTMSPESLGTVPSTAERCDFSVISLRAGSEETGEDDLP